MRDWTKFKTESFQKTRILIEFHGCMNHKHQKIRMKNVSHTESKPDIIALLVASADAIAFFPEIEVAKVCIFSFARSNRFQRE